MYSIGEEFNYDIKRKDRRLSVIGDFFINKKEYLVTEDEDQVKHIFVYNDEEVEYVQDTQKSKDLIRKWQDKYYGTANEVELWDDNYNEEEIKVTKNEENYVEDESNYEESEDLNSYIDNLVSDNN
ncbi:MAG: hypothetical protein ACQERZ_08570 [Fusobacteriota bacterium]